MVYIYTVLKKRRGVDINKTIVHHPHTDFPGREGQVQQDISTGDAISLADALTASTGVQNMELTIVW